MLINFYKFSRELTENHIAINIFYLIRLIEEWKTHLDKNKIVRAVLLDLSKAFDCIPHDLQITELVTYGFDKEAS